MKHCAENRWVAAALSVTLLLCLTACGKDDGSLPTSTEEVRRQTENTAAPEPQGQTEQETFAWEPPGDDNWLPPTEEGLADSVWDWTGWSVELHRGGADPDYAGVAVLYRQPEAVFETVDSGVWRMEGGCLCLEFPNETSFSGSYPVEISPSGERLYVRLPDDGTCPPFFGEDAAAMEWSRSFG